MTQPTMGRRLKKLEEVLGHHLFQRTPDGFVLTDEGAGIRAHAERIEEEALALQRGLAGTEQQLEGMLRLSASDWFGSYVLAPLIGRFKARYPKVTVELITSARLLDLSRREADLVFRITPFTDPDVVSRKFMEIDYALYGAANKTSKEASSGTSARTDNPMADLGVITMDEAFAAMPDVAWLREILPDMPIAARSNNRDVQARLCAAGVGLAVLPKILAGSHAGLHEIETPTPPPVRTTWVGYHRDMRRSRRLRAFLDMAMEEVASIAP
jgi:DNA-binding transcriptional LysR family regulator